jgi:ankyrin repeat protein
MNSLPSEIINHIASFIKCNKSLYNFTVAASFISESCIISVGKWTIEKAAEKGYLSVVVKLLESGTNMGRGLILASREGHHEIVKVLLNAGAKYDSMILQNAIWLGDADLVEFLQNMGANCDAHTLQMASMLGHTEVCRYIYSLGVGFSINLLLNPPIRNVEMVEFFHSVGYKYELKNIDYAASQGYHEVADFLRSIIL